MAAGCRGTLLITLLKTQLTHTHWLIHPQIFSTRTTLHSIMSKWADRDLPRLCDRSQTSLNLLGTRCSECRSPIIGQPSDAEHNPILTLITLMYSPAHSEWLSQEAFAAFNTVKISGDAGWFGKHQCDQRASFNMHYKLEKVREQIYVCDWLWVYTSVHVVLWESICVC